MELKQFKITVVPLRDKLLNYARRMTDDPSDAEDAVQEVMLKLWNLRQKLDEYRSIEAVWICGVPNDRTLYHSTVYRLPPLRLLRSDCWKRKMSSD